MSEWTLLSNHGMTLLCVAQNPGMRLRDIGDCVGVTERAAHRLIGELVDAGYVVKRRDGNRNVYEVVPDVPMRHPMLQGHWVGELLAVLVSNVASPSERPKHSSTPVA